MIKHSELAKYIISRFGTGIIPTEIMRMTSGGVAPEGGVDLLSIPPVTATVAGPKYRLGEASLAKLELVIPPLKGVVLEAITVTTQDFTVMETLRSLARQRELMASGATRTLESKHLKQADGFAHAVDLGAWNDGKVTWGFNDYFEIVMAMDIAATKLGFADRIRWGGIWDMRLSDFGGISLALYSKAIEEYKVRHKGADFLDGPHFEWCK
jgi:peptidoglycan L-alanyl-D-glutamate endopeptidase CwlK